ncbi:LysR substrate-binding protein [Gemmatirosa kalamazoonensis]|uniref:LysR substrate-binding protein n=2 Tax=Gemmatirosa kalamazoonensis TaxID=861299 RepID=W0RGG6_9BACT|nr:LysR substrate-binding protein [Gemmatirosa kalamazoonensis]
MGALPLVMALNLHYLRVFAAVADQRGFTKAAAALHLSQPAVSKAVRGIERQVGAPLLERGARGVRLTDAGAVLHARARELFAVERSAEEELRALRGLEGGTLRIGASTTIATYLLPRLLGRFRARHPGVELRVATANTRAVARRLVQRRLDVALVEGPVAHPRIEVLPWRDDALVVVAPVDHPLARRRRVAPEALAAEPFIARERGSGTRRVAEAALRAAGVAPRRLLTLGSTAAVTQAVAAGLGLAIVSRLAAADQLALGRVALVRVPDLAMRRALTRLRLVGREPSAAARAFDELLEDD